MLRTTLAKAYIHRTLRPLYGWTQATPKACFLVSTFSPTATPVYPGMCMMRAGGDNVDVIDATGNPYGLSGLYSGGDGIDEVGEQGVNATSVWILGPDAEFEVLAPAFDTAATWTDPTNGTSLLVHAHTGANSSVRGQLAPSTASDITTRPVARLIRVASASSIIIGGLIGTVGA